jgi:hypothetical protein
VKPTNSIERRKKEKYNLFRKAGLNSDISYSKYTVGGDAKVPTSTGLGESDDFTHKRQQNQAKEKNSKIRSKEVSCNPSHNFNNRFKPKALREVGL